MEKIKSLEKLKELKRKYTVADETEEYITFKVPKSETFSLGWLILTGGLYLFVYLLKPGLVEVTCRKKIREVKKC